jgi:hypothetical protein
VATSIGHDHRQPKLEEGTGAFWQVRIKIVMAGFGCRLFGSFAAVALGQAGK